MADELTPKMEKFAKEYLVDLNATQAAIRSGYSKNGASVRGTMLLADVRIQTKVAELRAELAKTTVSPEMVLAELSKVGFSDIRKLMSQKGNLLDPCDWDDDTAAAVSSMEIVSKSTDTKDEDGGLILEYVSKLKTWDKLAALDKIARHLGMYEADVAKSNINVFIDSRDAETF